MNLFVEKVAGRALSAGTQMADTGTNATLGQIVRFDDNSSVLAETARLNPLAEGAWDWLAASRSELIVTWSGTLGSSLFTLHPLTWLRPGHEALEALCDQVQDDLVEQQRILVFQPHARHVLSDVQTCMRFLAAHQGQPFGLAFSPASLLEPSMLPMIEDHLIRAFETLGPACTMLCLHDVRHDTATSNGQRDDAGECLVPAPLGAGQLPRELVLDLMARHVPESTPIILIDDALDDQLTWLGRPTTPMLSPDC